MRHNLVRAIPVLLALAAGANAQPQFTADNQLIRPKDYREWVYLTSGLGMSYGPATANQISDASPVFDNVFVNPASYKAFLATGKWPDKTIFILEIRSSASHGSINKNGHFQTEVVAVEAAVKDEAHIPDKWGYYGFSEGGGLAASAKIFPKSAGCFGCHTANGAVDNTFVQFYPALLEVAEAKGTLNASYHPVPTPNKMIRIISDQGWDKGHAVFEEVKAKDPDADIFKESALNQMGYRLLRAGKKTEAAAVAKLATERYPASCNAQDSLAEIYEANGQKELAIASSKKAIELAPADSKVGADRKQRVIDGAKKRIERLNGQ